MNLIMNNTYSVLVKAEYESVLGFTGYFMVFSKQFGITYHDDKTLEIILKK